MNWKKQGIICLALLVFLMAGIVIAACDDDDDDSAVGGTVDDDAVDDDVLDDDSVDDDTGVDDDALDDDTAPTLINVSGNAFMFPDYEYIVGAEISIFEMPDRVAVTGAEGYFEFVDLPAGQEASFVLRTEGYPETQTKTFILPEEDLERVTFQVPDWLNYFLLALVLQIWPDQDLCQIVTTVTMVGRSIYDEGAHGEAGATVSEDPDLPPEHGPVYFNDEVMPDRNLTESSEDGGVVYTNVPPGIYTLSAHKQGVDFIYPVIERRPGVLVNASPPYGLQALEE